MIPIDVEVIKGVASVDESTVTGESAPVELKPLRLKQKMLIARGSPLLPDRYPHPMNKLDTYIPRGRSATICASAIAPWSSLTGKHE